MHSVSKKLAALAMGVVIGLIVTGWVRKPAGPKEDGVLVDSGPRVMMGTVANIKVVADSHEHGQAAIDRALATLNDLNARLSTYVTTSELSKVNREAARHPVAVSADTFELLETSLKYCRLSEGAFDITVQPIIRLWKTCGKANRLPTDAEMTDAKSKVGWQKLQLDAKNKTVRFTVPGMEITADAIAEGYVVDRAKDALRGPGVKSGLVDVGGEIAVFGPKVWIIGIQDPFDATADGKEKSAPRWKVRLDEKHAITTAGNYRRFVTIDGKRHSHIIDPRTGQSVDAIPSVTIVAEKAIDADAIDTAVSVMGVGPGMKLVRELGVEAFLISGDETLPAIIATSGFTPMMIFGEDDANEPTSPPPTDLSMPTSTSAPTTRPSTSGPAQSSATPPPAAH